MSQLLQTLQPYEDKAALLEGWVLEYEPETLGPDPSWDYEERALQLARQSGRMLDLGTGGGEVLGRIIKGVDCDVYATEEWHVNAPVAARNLARSARVARALSTRLPFGDASFDLVLARHEEIEPAEVHRVCRQPGTLLTQQVVHDYMHELSSYFSGAATFPNHLQLYTDQLSALGWRVSVRECRSTIRFRHLGHLVYHLVAAPWTVPGFSVRTHTHGLEQMARELEAGKGLVFTAGYYLIEAAR